MISNLSRKLLIKIGNTREKDNYATNLSKNLCTLSVANQIIKQLEKKDLVVHSWVGTRKILKLTKKGKRVIYLLQELEKEWN